METKTDVTGGASTATAVDETDIPSLQDMTEPERAAYLKDGTPPKREAPPKSDDGKKPVETGAASDTANKDDQEPKNDSEPDTRGSRRFRKLNNENKRLNDEIKALRAQLEAKSETKPPVSTSADGKIAKAPKLKSFTEKIGQPGGYADWDAAHEAYEDAAELFHTEQRKTAVQEALQAERDRMNASKAQDDAKKQLDDNAKSFAERAVEFRKTLTTDDFQESFTAVKEAIDEAIAAKSTTAAPISNVFIKSKVGPELVNYFGKHLDEFDDLLEMSIDDALIEIGELSVSDKIKAPKPKTITAAKKTTSTVTGKQAVPEDELEAAVNANDVTRYITAANKQETGHVRAPRWGGR